MGNGNPANLALAGPMKKLPSGRSAILYAFLINAFWCAEYAFLFFWPRRLGRPTVFARWALRLTARAGVPVPGVLPWC